MPTRVIRYESLQGWMTTSATALDPAPQHLGDAPGLRDTSARCERRLGVEYFADGSDAGVSQMRREAVQKLPSSLEIAGMYLEPRVDERPDQPRPHGSLMIGGVARAKVAIVPWLVVFGIR